MSRRLVPAVTAALALGVAGCGDNTTTNSQASGSASRAVTGHRMTVSMTDFAFKPKALSAKAGALRVTAENEGSAEHELVLIRTTTAANALPTEGDRASEAGSVGEIPDQKPGKAASHTFKLKPGRYVYICNVPGHYNAGMRGTLKVK